jgi:hypothetical protein
MSTTKIETSLTSGALPEWLALVWRQVGSLRYGAVETNARNRLTNENQIVKTTALTGPPEVPNNKKNWNYEQNRQTQEIAGQKCRVHLD